MTHGVHETLASLLVPVDSLEHYPGNARTHAEAVLRESLEVNGQYRPLVARASDRRVLAGNGTLAAARELGWSHVAVTFVDVDDETARRIVLVDNRANDLAGYDEAALVELLTYAAPDLTGTGYDEAFLARLLASTRGSVDPDSEWDGMPDYESDNLMSVFHVVVHFKSATDADEFFARIERPKQRSMWWPAGDGHVGSDARSRYVEAAVGE